jgi:Family of unknown function (DUF6788)
MKTTKLQPIARRIEKIRRELQQVGEMRPGSLSQQYRIPKEQIGPFYQLSYTRKMKSHTEYVRPQFVKQVKRQVAAYKRFRQLTDEWIELAIEQCKLKMEIAKKGDSG